MNPTRSLLLLAGTASLALFLACGGGGGGGGTTSTPTPSATSLSYTDPVISGGSVHYWLKKNTTLTTSTKVVLDLVTDDATTGSGVAFELNADATKVTWTKVQAADAVLAENGNTFVGGSSQVVAGKAAAGTLSVAASQKGLANPQDMRTASGKVLATVSLSLAGGATPGAVSLSQVASKAKVLYSSGTIATITVTAGTLTAN